MKRAQSTHKRKTQLKKIRAKTQKRQGKLKKRLANAVRVNSSGKPTLTSQTIKYELSDRVQATGNGGIGAIHNMVGKLGLQADIDEALSLLKINKPYMESDHVLNIAYNSVLGGTCLEDIELRRNDSAHLDALGLESIPDPTTAGDFCRRFDRFHLDKLMDVANQTRLRVWSQQPETFFEEAVIDADGSMVETLGECKEGMDINYKSDWGYHPLLISLANTCETLFIVNRPGNRPSHEGAAGYLDKAGMLCEEAGFKRIVLRGDTDFSQTAYLDGWDARDWQFTFGMDAKPNFKKLADELDESCWTELKRPEPPPPKTRPRSKPDNIKEKIVEDRGYKNLTLEREDIAEFPWKPVACSRSYRMVALRKNILVYKGQELLFPETRYFFYITNDRTASCRDIVLSANQRCNQENLIQQLKEGTRSLHAPVNTLHANWAYMLISSMAWSLKAWFALLMPVHGRWNERHQQEKDRILRMEFKGFIDRFIRIPCQVVRKGRQLIYRVLNTSPDLNIFFRAISALEQPLRQ